MTSILTTVKQSLNIPEDHEEFDNDIIVCINAVLLSVTQLGIGPSTGFFISDKTAAWDDLCWGRENLTAVQAYVGLKVRMMFDPPQSGEHAKAINAAISELEWRLSIEPKG